MEDELNAACIHNLIPIITRKMMMVVRVRKMMMVVTKIDDKVDDDHDHDYYVKDACTHNLIPIIMIRMCSMSYML